MQLQYILILAKQNENYNEINELETICPCSSSELCLPLTSDKIDITSNDNNKKSVIFTNNITSEVVG